jgi:hypothetical protein
VYIDIGTGSYSWNATAKTVTAKPDRIRDTSNDEYGAFQTKEQYRATQQAMIDAYRQQYGQAAVDQQLASMGFSSVAEYLDYYVAQAFKSVTCNYDFSGDNKALFLDEPLPADRGTNELSGKTFTRTYNGGGGYTETYSFTATDCTYTATYGGSYSDTETYFYAFDSVQKLVYLKTPTDGRQSAYNTQVANNSSQQHYGFTTVDDYNAAMVNTQYSRQCETHNYNVSDLTME